MPDPIAPQKRTGFHPFAGLLRAVERMKFRTKIALGISGIVVAMAVIFAVTLGEMASRAVLSEGRKRGRTVAENLAMRAAEPLIADDLLRLKNLVDELKKVSPDIVYAFIMDESGHVLAHTFQNGFPVELIGANPISDDNFSLVIMDTGAGYIYDFAAPVRLAGSNLGTVRLGLSREQLLEPVSRLNVAVLAISSVSLLIALIAGLAFAHRVTRRINLLKKHAESVVMGNLDVQSAPLPTRHCWECMNCNLTTCPAYGDPLRRCWYMAGHLDDNVPDTCVESCRDCVIYRQNAGDEIQNLAEAFDVMSVTLNTHIKELREAESNLRRQQELLRTIMTVTPDFIALFDNNLRYMSANKAFTDFVHMPEEEIIGKTDEDLFAPENAKRRAIEARAALETDRVRKAEISDTSNGGERWFHVVWTPVRDSEGRTVGLLRTSRDMTEVREYQEQLLHSQKMESLGKLAGGVAHEINTPLGVILGYAQLLQDDVDHDSQIYKDLKTIEKQAKVCRQIVSDLLGFSRRAESTKREMCLNNSVMEVVTLVSHTFNLDHVEIITDMDDRMPIIFGDPEKLKQVWINLLNNARDAMHETGGAIIVMTRLYTPQQKVTIWVGDTGPGIPPDTMPKIFDPFFSTKAVGEGTGLGLSVSFGIIEDHDGSIEATSPLPGSFVESLTPQAQQKLPPPNDRGPGTVFVVDLPLDHEESIDTPVASSICKQEQQELDIEPADTPAA